jgi:aconitate hydratase 2/2-methylisocitrate dehydratase
VLEAYREHVAERAAMNIPPKPLSPQQVADLVELLKAPPVGEEESYLLDLISNRVPPGVDEAAYVKAAFLSDIALGKVEPARLSIKRTAIDLLGDMHGGYNIETLVTLLDRCRARRPQRPQSLSTHC